MVEYAERGKRVVGGGGGDYSCDGLFFLFLFSSMDLQVEEEKCHVGPYIMMSERLFYGKEKT